MSLEVFNCIVLIHDSLLAIHLTVSPIGLLCANSLTLVRRLSPGFRCKSVLFRRSVLGYWRTVLYAVRTAIAGPFYGCRRNVRQRLDKNVIRPTFCGITANINVKKLLF